MNMYETSLWSHCQDCEMQLPARY